MTIVNPTPPPTSLPPSGAASGDLGGNYPGPTVAQISGALTHKGTTAGFYNVAPVARPAAYTLTFAAAGSRTLPADTSVSPASTASTSITPFGYTTAAQADAIRAGVQALIVDLDATKQTLKQVIQDLQANGLLQ